MLVLWYLYLCFATAFASEVHEFYFNVEYVNANPDGVFERQVISFNGSWPLPTIEVSRGDRVKVHLTNSLEDTTTSLHFHGLKMKGKVHMDGPVGVTQCPISPGETMLYDFVVEQAGTYWYHSHSGAQYSDGMRGLLIVHDKELESLYEFDKELIDGVYTHPKTATMAYLAVGQRMSIILKTKSREDVSSNILIFTAMDEDMLDIVPDDLELNSYNYMSYDGALPEPKIPNWVTDRESFNPIDDMDLVPMKKKPLFEDPDHRIEVVLHMENLGDGISYAFFNNVTYVAPKVPTLLTALSAPENLVKDSRIYGSNTNSFILNHDEIVEIVVNNEDDGKHPMHLHGHQFQVVARSPELEEPSHYNPENQTFPPFPMMRDTVMVEGGGFLVLRFKANNPGVWFFHCHLDFHLEQGLALTLVEAPDLINITLPDDQLNICKTAGIPTKGNAAGNAEDFLNLEGENVQPKPLPDGFTAKGYFALFLCTAIALFGLKSIYDFGMHDILQTESEKIQIEKKVIEKYIDLLELMKLTYTDDRSKSITVTIRK
ncbi:Iron transport multicopper oxidase FET3 [Pichia kudriavzevii]|uniref:Iron transport multicopper oxidase FET3 n=1 Tax=Pichia kudriavzevii TaxID=4909 RepID=A0A1V2LLQ2_PICKU|nr:Iron transport multicopper oxidase FET3 [Pichia kudriavzevii]